MQYKWIIFISSILLTFVKFLVEVSYGRTLIDLLKAFPTAAMTTLQWTGSLVAALESIFVWQVLILNRLFGYTWTLRIGVILGTIGLVLASFSANEFQLMISYGLLFGYGGVFLVNVGLFLVAANFPRGSDYHVFTTSFKLSIFPLAVAAVPITNQMLLIWGWRITYSVYAGIITVLGLAVSAVFGKYRERDDSQIVETDKSTGSDYNFSKETRRNMFVIVAIQMVSSFLRALFLNVPIYILPKHSHQLGFTLHQGSSLVSYFGIAEACTRLATAFLGDGFLKKRMMYLFTACYSLAGLINTILGYTATTYINLILYAATIGALTGPVMAGYYAFFGELLLGYYVNELYSLGCMAWGLGFLVGMLVEGFMFDLTNSFQDVYLLMSAMQITTALLLVIMILVRRKIRIQCI